jgi:hypothetical protein
MPYCILQCQRRTELSEVLRNKAGSSITQDKSVSRLRMNSSGYFGHDFAMTLQVPLIKELPVDKQLTGKRGAWIALGQM